ncbi:tetratricopeptide repeat protein [Minwuia thermotolerans]|uniref:Uncharacterized protein n=1 Tax=Minwuia thermotolerans TaxID=2056226 RepID=A0A2M9FX39_9PROT|nr:tetratricopeptide repeat protein [Minwuia thermotolerans]PJK28032.1 hypothetical protein CVT23_18510 [Minwuia thermotolerans]
MLRTIAILAALALPFASSLAQQVDSYTRCLEAVRADAEKGLQSALQWRDVGGGVPARHCTAVAYAANGQHRIAGAQLQTLADELAKSDSRAAAEVMGQAAAMWTLGQAEDKALRALEQALAWQPENPALHLDRALLLAGQDRFGPAEQSASRAIQLNDLMVEAYAVRAMIRRSSGNFAGAEEDTATALALAPDNPHAIMERARARARGGDMDGARDDLTGLVARDPEASWAESARRLLEELELEHGD